MKTTTRHCERREAIQTEFNEVSLKEVWPMPRNEVGFVVNERVIDLLFSS